MNHKTKIYDGLVLLLVMALWMITKAAAFHPSKQNPNLDERGYVRRKKSAVHHPHQPGERRAPLLFLPGRRFHQNNMKSNNDNSNDGNNKLDANNSINVIATVGILVQPVVWTSYYFVITTGAGLPSGPFGLLGALEGLSYLVMVGFAFRKLLPKQTGPAHDLTMMSTMAETLSVMTLGLGLTTLAKLVGDQGCVPNAKPLLDYSSYLPVCPTDETPGLFGK